LGVSVVLAPLRAAARLSSVEGMKRIGVATLWVIGIYFVARALAEPFVK
jgi:hypothetical protein